MGDETGIGMHLTDCLNSAWPTEAQGQNDKYFKLTSHRDTSRQYKNKSQLDGWPRRLLANVLETWEAHFTQGNNIISR